MAVKYTRNDGESARARISDRLDARTPARRTGLFSFGQGSGGGGMILSLAIVIIALMLYQGVVDRMQGEPPPVQTETASGTVVGKADAGPDALGERPMLLLLVETDHGVMHEVWVPTDRESWESVIEGDILEVDYAVRGEGDSVQVLRLREALQE